MFIAIAASKTTGESRTTFVAETMEVALAAAELAATYYNEQADYYGDETIGEAGWSVRSARDLFGLQTGCGERGLIGITRAVRISGGSAIPLYL